MWGWTPFPVAERKVLRPSPHTIGESSTRKNFIARECRSTSSSSNNSKFHIRRSYRPQLVFVKVVRTYCNRGEFTCNAASRPIDDAETEPTDSMETQQEHTFDEMLSMAADDNCRVSLKPQNSTEVKPISDAFWGALFALLAFLGLGVIDMCIAPTGLPFMIGSYGTISILLFGAPDSPVLFKWNIVVRASPRPNCTNPTRRRIEARDYSSPHGMEQ